MLLNSFAPGALRETALSLCIALVCLVTRVSRVPTYCCYQHSWGFSKEVGYCPLYIYELYQDNELFIILLAL